MIATLKQALLNLRIERKLNFVIVVTCAVALLGAGIAMFAFQEYHFRRGLVRDLQTTAEIIAANSLGALTFRDRQAGADVLASLKAKPQITYASLHLKDGIEFARRGPAERRDEFAARALRDGLRVEGTRLLLAQPIMLDGARLGTLYLDADIRDAHRTLIQLFGGITALVLMISILVSFLLSNRLQRLISGPILNLVGVAQAVAEERNYAVRAQKRGDDEVGDLTDAFNHMLSRIESDADTMRQINVDLQSEIVERERTEAARCSADQRFRSLTESANAAILSIDRQGRITSWNKGGQLIFGYAEGEVIGERLLDLFPERYHAILTQAAEGLLVAGSDGHAGKALEMHSLNKERLELPVELSLYSWQVDNESYFGVILRDITERKRAAQELEALNKQLRETSRQAGMAEVATGVLHNVGNVLNSVNVSATVVAERLRQSKASNIARVAAMLQEPGRDLADFLTRDPRGQQVPGFLAKLAEHLAGEQASQLQELDLLRKNVDHIKEIVAMQQAYAKVSGLVEPVAPASLVDDALNMNTAGLEGLNADIVRDYDEVPLVAVDRHKAMQILVNLIRNAKHALQDGKPACPRLTLQIARQGSDRVKIAVSDNGIGIPPENLTRVFQHGFTTKPHGHGFGLHSGANAAKEMGGSLSMHSAGVQQGATFTLELPVSIATPSACAA